MARLHRAEAEQRSQALAAAGAPLATYRAYPSEFRVEVRATGNPASPYVGVLHYTEQLYACRTGRAPRCQLRTSTPVTEIFLYRDGRWVY